MTFSTKIDLTLQSKLKKDLETQGFEFTTPPYTIFSARKKGISVTLYESGKLTVQGKEMAEFMEFYLEPEILQSFEYTNPDLNLDLEPRIGMDEAGKGDYFGPLCVAAIYIDTPGIQNLRKMGVMDSKKISDAKIQKIAAQLKSHFPYTVIRLFPKKYNELHAKFKNLNRLLGWAHAAALGDMAKKTNCKKALLDQFAEKHIMLQALQQKKIAIELEQKVRGEEDLVVAAASILARAAFLDGLKTLSAEIGTDLPKGAGEGVKQKAKDLVSKHGRQILEQIAKIHFKTTGEICAN